MGNRFKEPSPYLEDLSSNNAELKSNFNKALRGSLSKKDIKNIFIEKGIDYANTSMESAYQKRHPGYTESKFNTSLKGGLYLMDNFLGAPLGHGIYGAGLATRENFDIHYNMNPLGLTDDFERSWHAFERATDLGL